MPATATELARGRGERGGARLKAILWTAVLLYGAFVTYKIIPPYLSNYQLQDKIQEVARFAVVNHQSSEQIRDTIFKEAQERELPVRREAIKVDATQNLVRINLDYTVPVDLKLYQLNLHFTPSSENRSVY